MTILNLPRAANLPIPPDIYRQTAFEILRLTHIYHDDEADKMLLAASNACGVGRASGFHLSMFQFRAHCRELIALSHKIEREFDSGQADEWQDCPTVYAP